MDRVSKTFDKRERQRFSELINVKEFRSNWMTLLNSECSSDRINFPSKRDEEIKKSMKNTDEKLYKSLRYDCSPNNLDCGLSYKLLNKTTKKDIVSNTIPLEDGNLLSTRNQIRDIKKRENSTYRSSSIQYWRENQYFTIASKNLSESNMQDLENDEVLLEVEIYKPAKFDPDNATDKNKSQLHRHAVALVMERYMVIGDQYLSCLRDKITCPFDLVRINDMSDLSKEIPPQAKDVYKSGFFYINGVFYNDMRYPNNKDYSQVIIDWAAQSTPNFGPYKTEKLEEAKFIDLNIKLGYPYLYQHQGDCEHIVIFNNLRMINEDDSHNSEDYPMTLATYNNMRTVCMLCGKRIAKWITLGNQRVFEDPFYYCKKCYSLFNYTKTGEKIGTFKAYNLE